MKYFETLTLILITILALWSCKPGDNSFRGTELGDNIPTEDFTLTDQEGNPFTLSDQREKVVLLFFGFTYCPDVCPATLSVWSRVQDSLGDKVDQVEFVYVTVDPERDTAEKLQQHLSVFSDDFIGLTGALPDLQKVYAAYGVYREKVKISDTASGYIINHTSRINIIDTNGRWRLSFPHHGPAEDLLHDIRLLLGEAS